MPDVNNEAPQYVDWFRQSSPYINAHRGKTFVLMLGGDAVVDANFANIVHDIVLLNSLGVRLVLVYGSRLQIEQRLAERGLQSRLHHDMRITDSETLDCVIDACGYQRCLIEARLSMGLANTPMHGARIRVCSGNFVTARPYGIHEGVDLMHTGEVRRVDKTAIARHLDQGEIILLSNIGYSPTGEMFNLGVEEVATEAAKALGAEKLILFGSTRGVFDSSGELRSELLARTAERMVKQYLNRMESEAPDQEYTELSRQLDAAVIACNHGIPRCHLISYQENGALLSELFTRDGAGTMVVRESYEQVRQASIEDVGGILELIAPLEQAGILVRRSRELLEAEIEQFTIVERDGAIIACAALYPFIDEGMGELACVAVSNLYRGGERGDMLLGAIAQVAREMGLTQLFVLTTRTAHWFVERGFVEAPLEQLPGKRKELYNYQRNSKVFIKPI
ncbi:amino-acid N-acetyltransferase [Marinobacterium rhizophilum]|uniref:Amino-acid acetyltransferase n=1 Tax=Marinobacterium rhizophilum TaxID=420402 RepID=A0ABY5HH56_9GAMM|nr:amino-acid N-acetyltransferase [Marinobacterium rhizophilum]UTW10595.1 amino-acid N-acetyltransferase [Marinobacterium rhizophilum]